VIRHITLLPQDGGIWKGVRLHPTSWEIYCLKEDSWRKVDAVDISANYHTDVGVRVYMDEMCHWWGQSETRDEVYLVSFDLSSEVFVKTYIPSIMDDVDSGTMFRHLDVLNGSIGWILNYTETATLHISILGEIRVKESWTKLFIVGLLSCVEHPIGVGKKGNIFFRKKDDELVWFNLSTQRIEELGMKSAHSYGRIMIFKENLLPIRKINNWFFFFPLEV